MIDDKDIVFGLVRRKHGVELCIDFNDPKLPGQLFGALSFLAATDEDFFTDLKACVQNVEENGEKIRQLAATQRASGQMIVLRPNKTKL